MTIGDYAFWIVKAFKNGYNLELSLDDCKGEFINVHWLGRAILKHQAEEGD